MDPTHWELVGVLSRAQGKDGQLLLKVKKDFPEGKAPEEGLVFIPAEREDEGIPFYLTQCERISKKHYVVRLDLIDDPSRAERMIGLGVWLPRSDHPDQEQTQSLLERVDGFRVIDQGELGYIEGGIERSEQPLAHVGPEKIPIPLTEDLIREIDEAEKILYTKLPEGLTRL
ncbi:MAG: ribosome maturation factor RimM [Flavobacteriales bacterium]